MAFSPSLVPQPSLLEVWLNYCSQRGLTPEILDPMGGILLDVKRTADKMASTAIFGFPGAIGAYVFPLAPGELQARVIYGPPPEIPKVGAALKKPPKYYRPKGSHNLLYVPPHLTDWRADTEYNLLIVEGALNAARLAANGYHAVAVQGVQNYRVGDKGTPIIPDLVNFARSSQAVKITILFDSDADTNPQLYIGVNQLCLELIKLRPDRKETIYRCMPPSRPDGTKNGPDDYLNAVGMDEFNKMLRERSEVFAEHPYLKAEGEALTRFIHDESCSMFFDTKMRAYKKSDAVNDVLRKYGYMDDLLANRMVKMQYNKDRLLSCPQLRTAQGIQYMPDHDDIFVEDTSITPSLFYINRFQPEDVPQSIKGDVSIAYRVMNSICRSTPAAVQKMLVIAARHAQFPARTPKYAIHMIGDKGAGKSSLARLIGLSLSKRFTDVNADLNRPYNSHWRGFACKEWQELNSKMDPEWLKTLITGETYEVSEAYVGSRTERNYTLNIFTTNMLQAKIEKGDRRFLICGEAKADNKALGLEFEAWVNGMGPNFFRYHLLNDIDCSGYDNLDIRTELTDAVVEASQSFRATVADLLIEECSQIPGLECLPNSVAEILLEKHKINTISFMKQFGLQFIKPGNDKVKIDGAPVRFRAFANHDKWRKEENPDEYRKQFKLAEQLLKRNKYDG